MSATQNTMKELLKIAGRVLFIIGLIGVVFSLLVGFWPGAGAILLMLSGAVVIAYSNSMLGEGSWGQVNAVAGNAVFKVRSLAERVDMQKLKKALRTVAISIAAFFVFIICLFVFGQNYFKARDTRADGKEMVAELENYNRTNHNYPDNLNILIGKNPLHAAWEKDRWANAYRYTTTGAAFTLRSAGKDGKFETGDDVVLK